MISLDTETTGVDLRHGARPFFVTTCDEEGNQAWWSAVVDPITRMPQWSETDLDEIAEALSPNETGGIVLQNAKFDITALASVRPEFGEYWRWEDTDDTLLAGHLLASNQPHDLTTMALVYLGVNIQPLEDDLKQAIKEARALAGKKEFIAEHGQWQLARKNGPGMPSAKEKVGKFDSWLPCQLAKTLGYPLDHPWYTVLQDYANGDSAVTIQLWLAQKAELEKRGLWEIYLERRKLLGVVYGIERRGVTLSKTRLEQLEAEYKTDGEKAGRVCVNLAKSLGYDLELPKSGNNGSLRRFVFDTLNLPVIKRSAKTGEPSLDAKVIEEYESTLPERSKGLLFVRTLGGKRKRDTALSYMESYRRFWLPWTDGSYILYPSLNPTGTDTLRFSSSNPNEQNISKKENFNLRHCFGPAPGREWWSCDAKNIELRLPAYEAGETEMVALFERPNDPPYYGSYHMLVFDTLHPEKFAQHGMKCKEVYESTWYQWTKNGNFAVQYGAIEKSGTADRAYHVPGAQRRIQQRFSKIAMLNQRMIAHAEKHGYVETMPDKTVNPERGYPLLCTRSKWGKILPTVPLNYHVQGTAMWWMSKAMVRCHEYLRGTNAYIVMQVHDEMVFDFPKGTGPEPWKTNLPKIRKIQRLMAQGGEDIGVPTPVSRKYHPITWSEGISV